MRDSVPSARYYLFVMYCVYGESCSSLLIVYRLYDYAVSVMKNARLWTIYVPGTNCSGMIAIFVFSLDASNFSLYRYIVNVALL